MKKMCRIISAVVITFVLCAGCGNTDRGNRIESTKTVDAVLQSEIDKSVETQEESAETEVLSESIEEESSTLYETEADENVDVDISVMGKDMVYATVYQLLINPDSYIDKSIKIKGIYYSAYDENTGVIYHFALIQDAAACCAQGLEFVLADGLEYPEEESQITVVGYFETYEEEGNLYCRLRDAVIQ